MYFYYVHVHVDLKYLLPNGRYMQSIDCKSFSKSPLSVELAISYCQEFP